MESFPLHPGSGLEAQVRAHHRPHPKAADVIGQDGVAAGVTQRADLLVHAHRREIVFEDQLSDKRPKGIELRCATFALPRRAAQPRAHRLGIDAELTGNRLDSLPVGRQLQDQAVALRALPLSLLALLAHDPSR